MSIRSLISEFALIGDMPYDAGQREEFVDLMQEINAADYREAA